MPEAIVVRISAKDIRKLSADLRVAEGRTVKELAIASKNSAEIGAARARVLAPKGPHHPGRVSRQDHHTTIRAQGSALKAFIVFGGARAPHSPVTNFGGTVPRYHSLTKSRVPRREHIYEAIAQTAPQRTEEYNKAITRIVHSLL